MPVVGTIITVGYVGAYTTEAKLVQFLGQYGVDVYADADGDGNADAGAVQQAVVAAEGVVNFRTGGGPFTLGADLTLPGPVMLEKWSRYLAAVELAQKRLGVDAPSVNALRVLRQEAYDEMAMYAEGDFALVGATPSTAATQVTGWSGEQPTATFATVDGEGRTISAKPPLGIYWDENARIERIQ